MARRRTLRGTLQAGQVKRLIVDDGNFTNGIKIKSFAVWSPTASNDGFAILSRNEDLATPMDPCDGAQIGWAVYSVATTNLANAMAWIDPDHVIQQDLYISVQNGLMAYLIEAEEVNLTDAQGVLQMVKTATLND